ncbi:hypothetical protein WR25_26017 [Diploscapter pachys]|uniref:Response regulatory domain-containing protein n=3 Tax=cellular organisms TaxID=131567 RepID=A0A2A2K4S5_9BILA|nr:CheY-like chemotaxis protein [Sphingomonas abaci]PAV68911.1 hypothetical protein WR25_26017 [Diploscapter pachys]
MDARSILEDAGYRCHEADDGDGAIDLLGQKAEQIMLLFSDVEMPGSLDGFELARKVFATWPWIDIVIASGRITPEPGDMPENATFISKPFTARLVHDHLRQTLPDGKKPEPLKEKS